MCVDRSIHTIFQLSFVKFQPRLQIKKKSYLESYDFRKFIHTPLWSSLVCLNIQSSSLHRPDIQASWQMIAASVLNGFNHPGHSDGSSVGGTVRRGPGVIGGSKPIFACPFSQMYVVFAIKILFLVCVC